jgi:type IV pilus assembly protein PilA
MVEMMVVVLIIAILIAVGIPTLVGSRARAANRAAQSLLVNALTAERVIYSDRETYTDAITGPEGLQAAEPALTYVADAAPTTRLVSVHLGGTVVTLGTRSDSGECFYVRDNGAALRTDRFGRSGACPKPSAVPDTAFGTKW